MNRFMPLLLALAAVQACTHKPFKRAGQPPSTRVAVDEAVHEERVGDDLAANGKRHAPAGDPLTNPTGWKEENRLAMEYTRRALDHYERARELYEDSKRSIPARLMRKIQAASRTLGDLRKRTHVSGH